MRADCPRRRRHRRGRVRGVPRPESPPRFQPFARRLKFPLMAWRHAGDEFLGHLTGSHRPRPRHCAVCGSNVTTNHGSPSPTRFNFRFSIRQRHKRSAQLPVDESTPCGSAGAGPQLVRGPFCLQFDRFDRFEISVEKKSVLTPGLGGQDARQAPPDHGRRRRRSAGF